MPLKKAPKSTKRRKGRRRKSKFKFKPVKLASIMNQGYTDGYAGAAPSTAKMTQAAAAKYQEGYRAGKNAKASVMHIKLK